MQFKMYWNSLRFDFRGLSHSTMPLGYLSDTFFSAVSGICSFSWKIPKIGLEEVTKTEIVSPFPVLILGASVVDSVSHLLSPMTLVLSD